MSYQTFGENYNQVSVNTNYSKFLTFGEAINSQVQSPFNAANPLTYCLFPSLGSQFQHGSSTSTLLNTTYNPSCEYYMAERCSNTWDGFCDAYKQINLDTYWPNVGVIDGTAYTMAQTFLKNNRPTVGDILVRNAVNIKFLEYPYMTRSRQQFDPNTANSPDFTMYSNYTTSPSFLKKIVNVDQNEHVKLMLDNSKACFDVLARMYLAVLRNETNAYLLRNTIIEKHFKENEAQFQSFLRQSIPLIPSYQQSPMKDHTYQSCSGNPKFL